MSSARDERQGSFQPRKLRTNTGFWKGRNSFAYSAARDLRRGENETRLQRQCSVSLMRKSKANAKDESSSNVLWMFSKAQRMALMLGAGFGHGCSPWPPYLLHHLVCPGSLAGRDDRASGQFTNSNLQSPLMGKRQRRRPLKDQEMRSPRCGKLREVLPSEGTPPRLGCFFFNCPSRQRGVKVGKRGQADEEKEEAGTGTRLQARRWKLGSSADHGRALRAGSRAPLEACGARPQAGDRRALAEEIAPSQRSAEPTAQP